MSREGNLVVIATNIENGIHGEVGVLGDWFPKSGDGWPILLNNGGNTIK